MEVIQALILGRGLGTGEKPNEYMMQKANGYGMGYEQQLSKIRELVKEQGLENSLFKKK